MEDPSERGVPSSLRGWLSEVYFPALVSAEADQLARRLGDRATVDDPIFGRKGGMPALKHFLGEIASWLGKHGALFDKTAFTNGSDRDVTEGSLGLTFDGKRVSVPVAIVAERRPEREVELRLYYSTKPIHGAHAVRSPLLAQDDRVLVPPPVQSHLDALAGGNVAAVVGSFESGGVVRDPQGGSHEKTEDGGPLRRFYEQLLGAGGGADGAGIEVLKGARADDGRTCALEYTVVRVHGKGVAPQAGVAVYERGESGLLRSARIYEDVDIAPR